jgi:hypothetical protein
VNCSVGWSRKSPCYSNINKMDIQKDSPKQQAINSITLLFYVLRTHYKINNDENVKLNNMMIKMAEGDFGHISALEKMCGVVEAKEKFQKNKEGCLKFVNDTFKDYLKEIKM